MYIVTTLAQIFAIGRDTSLSDDAMGTKKELSKSTS